MFSGHSLEGPQFLKAWERLDPPQGGSVRCVQAFPGKESQAVVHTRAVFRILNLSPSTSGIEGRPHNVWSFGIELSVADKGADTVAVSETAHVYLKPCRGNYDAAVSQSSRHPAW